MAHIGAAKIIASYLTDFLGTKIDIMKVHDEMFLIEHKMEGKDKTLNQFVKKIMEDNMKKV